MEIATLVLAVIILISCISIFYLFIQQSKKIQEIKENVNVRLTAAESNIKEENERMLRELKSSLNIVEAQAERAVKATHTNGDLTIEIQNKNALLLKELQENVSKRLTAAESNIKEESEGMLRELKSSLTIVENQVERIVKATQTNGDLTIQSKNEIIKIHDKNTLMLNQLQESVNKLESKLAKDLVEDMNNLLKEMEELYTKYTKDNEIRINTALNKMQELSKNTENHLDEIYQAITEPLKLS